MKYLKYGVYYLMLVLLSASVISCDDDNKREDPDKRVFAKIDEYNNALIGAPYGWIVDIETEMHGIHTLWMEFSEKGRVSMYFDYVEYYRKFQELDAFESSYTIRALQLPTLSFDSYSYLSIFADPDQLNNGSGQTGTGLGSDFEYQILEYRNEEFNLLGLKNGMKAVMRKATQAEKEEIANGALMSNIDNAPSYQPFYYTFRYTDEKTDVTTNYDFLSNGRTTAFFSREGGEYVLQSKGSKIDLENNIIMNEPLRLGDYEIHYFTKTDRGYEAKVGNEVVDIIPSASPNISLLGPTTGSDRYYYFLSPLAMRSTWSGAYFDRYLVSLNQLLSWSLEFYNNSMGYYLTYISIVFYKDSTMHLELGYQPYLGGTLGSDVYANYYLFEAMTKNADGSITISNDFQSLDQITGNPGAVEFDEAVEPLLSYFAGETFFIKTWPVSYRSYETVALVPVNLKHGVMVGVVYDP